MAAPDTGPSAKKFTDSDVMAVFDEENRRHVGKIELTAKEVTEILNEGILPEGTTVTRQAVDSRLNDLVGDKLVRSKHGRSYLYRRPDDIDRLFSDKPQTPPPAPAGGGGGGEFQNSMDLNTTSLISNLGNSQTIWAGVAVMLLGGFLVSTPLFVPFQGTQTVLIGLFVALLGAFTIAVAGVAQLAQVEEKSDPAPTDSGVGSSGGKR